MNISSALRDNAAATLMLMMMMGDMCGLHLSDAFATHSSKTDSSVERIDRLMKWNRSQCV